MIYLLFLLISNAQADQIIGTTNENNIVYCSSCGAFINTNTGQKVVQSSALDTTPLQITTDKSDIAR